MEVTTVDMETPNSGHHHRRSTVRRLRATATGSTTAPNPAYTTWIQQDQSILSLIISSLSDEVMHPTVGKNTAREVWPSITSALDSSMRARCLSLLGQFQTLRQGNGSPAEYFRRAQQLVEAVSLAGRPLSLDEQILYVLRGLQPDYHLMASSLTVTGTPITFSQLSDLLQAHEFINSNKFPTVDHPEATGSPLAFFAGRRNSNSGGRQNSNDGGRGGRGGGGRG
ncbi:PREDICTED: uncharacterized protein LOC109168048 [Ipomoea nil]|uniref:uncharacterized protein LOC109168048 n=1 Tax=Ipomoea nil TaxID=35883 RepID=UPI000900D77F|nr:PREDICTED: uncharacterized protein LOC109168048 [Ipomoea nil]